MRLVDSPEEATWRAEVREFLEKELPSNLRKPGINERIGPNTGPDPLGTAPRPGGAGFRMPTGDMEEWRSKLATKGWIAPAWPK